ncbi:hypothetical protein T4C_3193, partial [Trichinella pseudospiralis]
LTLHYANNDRHKGALLSLNIIFALTSGCDKEKLMKQKKQEKGLIH